MGMMNRRPKYNQGVPLEEIPEVLVEFTGLVLAIVGILVAPIVIWHLHDSFSQQTHTVEPSIPLERAE
jgi:hypothetical protein